MSPRTTITSPAFKRASAIVQAILGAEWTSEAPTWADDTYDYNVSPYERAAQTAEAFIILFTLCNPNFRQDKFLYECGLGPKPSSKRQHKDLLMTRTNSREPNREELL